MEIEKKEKGTYVQPICKSLYVELQQIIAASTEGLEEEEFPW